MLSSCTAARLLEVRSAARSVIESASECSSSGSHAPCSVGIGSFNPVMTDAGSTPSIAAA